jgi:hypothetical protein
MRLKPFSILIIIPGLKAGAIQFIPTLHQKNKTKKYETTIVLIDTVPAIDDNGARLRNHRH